jgi:acetylornithine/N-succinyldiaminopimelate aminotransferase
MATTRSLFFEHLAQTSDTPIGIEIEHAEGCWMYAPGGKKYLDLISGIAVSNLGHGHPEIVNAVIAQVKKNMHLMVYGEFINAPQVELAATLIKNLPENLSCVYFVNSGSEAVEGAMKLCKRFTGRTEIISFENSYHGNTQGALSIIGGDERKKGFYPLIPGTKRIRLNNTDDLEFITENTAAVFIEPVQGEAGIRIATKNYLSALRKKCDETKTLLVFDEIQSGYGRTGKLFAFQHSGIIPDILLLAKGFGGGMPLGAFIASPSIMNCLRNEPVLGHITTFGGHPVSCAASHAALNVLLSTDLIEKTIDKENLFRSLLVHPKIRGIRGTGLMLAVELESAEAVMNVIQICIEKGVITDWFLFCDNSLRIAPPLTISNDEIEFACRVIVEAVS